MKKFVRELARDLSGRTQHLFTELLVEQLDTHHRPAGRRADNDSRRARR